eukprot:UN02627
MCSNGIKHEFKCATETLVWDDTKKYCDYTSACDACLECVSDCSGVADGDYRSCSSCHVYATCSNGILYDDRACATEALYWNDQSKTCEVTTQCDC